MNGAQLEFEGVSKWYGQVSALTDVSFTCGPGVTGLVGKNGAGKSTVIKLACGLLRPSQGRVLVLGDSPATDTAVRARIGLCPDLDRCYESLSGETFVTWMLRLQGFRAAAARARAREVLAELGLAEAMHRKIRGYSKGMRQRVKLAQAIAHRPQVLLLDEPLTGLDPIARHEVGELVRRLGSEGVVVLVSSHVLHELQAVADRVLLVHQGRLLAEGRIQELRDQLETRPLKLLLSSHRPRELAARIVTHEGVRELEIRPEGVVVATRGASILAQLTRIGAEEEGLLLGIEPLDASLEAVFGYLVA